MLEKFLKQINSRSKTIYSSPHNNNALMLVNYARNGVSIQTLPEKIY
jgi:hypothetical protein